MIKKLFCILLCAACVFCLTSCFDEEPGDPTAVDDTASNWSEPLNYDQNIEIDSDEAVKLNNDLAAALENQAQAVTPQDIQFVKDALRYMGQFNLFVHEDSSYIEQVNKLYTAFYNIYTGNCTKESVQEAIDAYSAAYASLSDENKEKMTELDSEKLKRFADNISRYSSSMMRD